MGSASVEVPPSHADVDLGSTCVELEGRRHAPAERLEWRGYRRAAVVVRENRVEEIAAGMTRDEVSSILGPPDRTATLADKTIYFYPWMKITFRAGKVVDVE